jgi:hypothetical protein
MYWGEQEKCCGFAFHAGKTVVITPTLHNILANLRRYCQTKHLWVDQICIDQGSISEYNQQVAIMGEIYGKAQGVLV